MGCCNKFAQYDLSTPFIKTVRRRSTIVLGGSTVSAACASVSPATAASHVEMNTLGDANVIVPINAQENSIEELNLLLVESVVVFRYPHYANVTYKSYKDGIIIL